MSIYFLPYIYFLLVSFVSFITKKPLGLACWIGAAALILLAGLRFDVDNDYNNYLYYFDQLPSLTEGWSSFIEAAAGIYLEPAFSLIIAALKSVFSDEWLFLAFATISVCIYAWLFNSQTGAPAGALLLYVADGFYLREFTQVRFGMAVALCAVAMCQLFHRKKQSFYFLSLTGALIHYSAVFFLVLPLWLKITHTRRHMLVASTILFLLSVSGVLNIVTSLLVASPLAPDRITFYADKPDANSVNPVFILIQYVLVVVLLNVRTLQEKHSYFVKVFVLSFFFLCVFSGFDLLRRISFIFATSLYFLFALNLRAGRWTPSILIIIFSLILIFSRLQILRPYQSLDLF